LIAFDGTLFQVLNLPPHPQESPQRNKHRARISKLIQHSLWEAEGGR
jgi:hypothetical protein